VGSQLGPALLRGTAFGRAAQESNDCSELAIPALWIR